MRVSAPRRATAAGVLAVAALVASASAARAACNLIPPAQQAFPSTTGAITSPVTTAGETVQLRLGACDASAGFDPVAANNVVAITFGAPGVGQPPPVIVAGGAITVDACGATCATLRFTMPSTPGLAGPAAISVTVGATVVAEVGPLFQAQTLGGTCDKQPETIFQAFTVLPPPNDFGDVESGAATEIVATLDASGAVIIPFDYRQVLPLGPGEPVARLISGSTTIDAFPDVPGMQALDVPSSYVRSFTIDGRPLPPLLRATDAGNEIFGATDGAVALIRVARDGSAGVKFDLASLRTNAGYGPIVIPSSEYAVTVDAAIPLENLRSTATGVSFARNEAIEGNLNPGSGDVDTDDHVVQLIDVGGFVSTNTGMAAAATRNPIVGGAALDVGPTLAAFLESESSQNATDLNGDGDVLDDVLRVFTVAGTQLTPSGTLVGSPFPGVNRRPVAIDGSLVYYREPLPGLDAGGGFGTGFRGAISPDGRYLYDVSPGTIGGLIFPWALDAEAGGSARDWLPLPVTGLLQGATDVAVSPDSRILFAAIGPSDTLESMVIHYEPFGRVELARVVSGTHVFAGGERVTDGLGGVDGLAGVHEVEVAPDGAHVYALAAGEHALTGFSVAANGDMTFVQTIKDGVDVLGMTSPVALAISPDGLHVYVAARGTGAVWAFARNPVTGGLVYVQALFDDVDVAGLGDLTSVAVSPDGANVYAISGTDGTLVVFTRHPVTGVLSFAQALDGGDVAALTGGRDVLVSPDGAAVYATTELGRLLVFARTMPGGVLTHVETEGPTFGVPLATSHLAISPDSEHVFQAFDGGANFQTYRRRNALRAFDVDTQALRPGLTGAPLAALVAVGGGRAVYTSPGGNVQLYDAATDTVTEIGGGIPAGKVALSATTIAMSVHEGSLGVDGNKDGDQNDAVLVVLSTEAPTGTPRVVPIQASAVGVTDLCRAGPNDGAPCAGAGDCPDGTCRGLVVVATNEFAYKDNGENPNPPEADFSGNGVVADTLVPFVYDTATRKLANVGFQAFDFAVGGRLLAFRSYEGEIAGLDLNGNGDDTDTVMLIYDLGTRSLVNPALTVVRCDIPGCEPGLPYKIIGDSVVFLVPEFYQGSNEVGVDLDGNGSNDDIVVVVYDVARLNRQVLSAVDPAGTLQQPASAVGTPPLLPTTFTGGTIVFKQVRESDIGKDVNEDGDQDDVVTLVEGDSDGDGVFDLHDTCTETADPEQFDSDADSLPDACDPNPYCAALAPAAPVVAPPAAEPCQRAVGKAVQKLTAAVEKATRGCLDKVASGKLVGDPTGLCRGGEASGRVVLPADVKTGAAIAKASAKLGSLAKKCAVADLPALAACADSVAGLVDCLPLQAVQSVRVTSAAAYGRVGAIADKTLRGCQKAIGKAGAAYFASATKAMTACLDDLNQGDLVGSGDTLCLGAGTPSGVTLPSDPDTAAKLQHAADALDATLAKACPGALAAGLDACGDDPTGLATCLRCAIGRRAIGVVGAAYGD